MIKYFSVFIGSLAFIWLTILVGVQRKTLQSKQMSLTPPIKNIIFDFGGVIINLNIALTTHAFAKLGFPDVFKRCVELGENSYFDRFEIGHISDDEFHAHFCGDFGIKVDRGAFLDAWNAMLLDIPMARLEFLKKLKERYRTFLLSNTNEIHIAAFHQYIDANFGLPDLTPLFEKVYYSSRMGLRKPDGAIYRKVCEDSGLDPHETIFIDDTKPNIDSAKLEGLQVLHLLPGMEMVKELSALLKI